VWDLIFEILTIHIIAGGWAILIKSQNFANHQFRAVLQIGCKSSGLEGEEENGILDEYEVCFLLYFCIASNY